MPAPIDALAAAAALLLAAFSLPALAQDLGPVLGTWTGPARFASKGVPASRTAGKLSLEITDDGQVEASDANGCRFSGVIVPGLAPKAYDLDVRLRDCAYAAFNRRWNGSVTLGPGGALALSLAADVFALDRPAEHLEARATLKR